MLDLGSGGGLDVFLAARRVGPTGRAIGAIGDDLPDLVGALRNEGKDPHDLAGSVRLADLSRLALNNRGFADRFAAY